MADICFFLFRINEKSVEGLGKDPSFRFAFCQAGGKSRFDLAALQNVNAGKGFYGVHRFRQTHPNACCAQNVDEFNYVVQQ